MVGHQAVRQESRLGPFDGFAKDPLESGIVVRVAENRHSGVGPIEDMINAIAFGGPGRSWHNQRLLVGGVSGNRVLTPFCLFGNV